MRENKILVLLITVSYARISLGYDCDCTCRQLESRNRGDGVVCNLLENLSDAVVANGEALKNWNNHYSFVKKFSENWKKEITEVVRDEIQNRRGDNRRNPKEMNRHQGQEDDMKTTPSPQKEDVLSLLEKRFRAMEARTLHLEKELTQQQKANGQLERNIEGTQSTLIAVTKQILNLTSTVDTIMKILLTEYPSIVGELNEKMTYFVQNLNADIKKLYEIQNANALWKLNKYVITEPPPDQSSSIISRLNALEDSVKCLYSSVDAVSKPRRRKQSQLPGNPKLYMKGYKKKKKQLM